MNGYLCGIPINEAMVVLMLYKEQSFVPSKNYMDGFKDGYKKAQTDFESGLKKAMYDAISHDGTRESVIFVDEVQE